MRGAPEERLPRVAVSGRGGRGANEVVVLGAHLDLQQRGRRLGHAGEGPERRLRRVGHPHHEGAVGVEAELRRHLDERVVDGHVGLGLPPDEAHAHGELRAAALAQRLLLRGEELRVRRAGRLVTFKVSVRARVGLGSVVRIRVRV